MKISIYSTAFNILGKGFDFKDAFKNWLSYSDEVCIAVNKSSDETFEAINSYTKEQNLNVRILQTNHSYDDPFCYGKIENSALQMCDGDILIQQNLDERIGGKKEVLIDLGSKLLESPDIFSFFVPVINLYKDYDHYVDFGQKWYIHKKGAFRGPVNFGIKEDGRPDYSRTSTDELIDSNGSLLPSLSLMAVFENQEKGLDAKFLKYCQSGLPFIYHLGYVDLKERVSRNKFWKDFWVKATGGDENNHSLDLKELLQRESKEHGIPLWK